MNQPIYLAEVETTNFTFQAYGLTYSEATLALKKIFEKHIKRTGGWLTWEEVVEDVSVLARRSGEGWVK